MIAGFASPAMAAIAGPTALPEVLRVRHIITSLGLGGAQTMLARLIASEPRSRIRSSVVSLIQPGPVAGRIERTGASVLDLGMPQGLPTLKGLTRLARLARAEPVGVVQGWMYHGNLAAFYHGCWQRERHPVVWNIRHSLHTISEEQSVRRVLIQLGALLSSRPAAIIYNSATSARQHHDLGYAEDKTVIIPNGFDCEVFKPDPDRRAWLAREFGIPAQRIILGHVARYHAMKDTQGLLRAIAMLRARGLDPHLVLVGRDMDQSNRRLLRHAAEAGVVDRLSFVGVRDDIAAIVPGLDIFVLPSAWGEGFSNALGEAMACGLPCVATDVGDSVKILGGTGRVVPRSRPEAMAAAIREVVELGADGRQRLGAAARTRVLQNYTLARITERYVTLYERLVDPSAQSLRPAELIQ